MIEVLEFRAGWSVHNRGKEILFIDREQEINVNFLNGLCSDIEDSLAEEMYNDAYDNGHKEGWKDGYNDGYDKGKAECEDCDEEKD